MTREEMLVKLQGDLKNEWTHLCFYLHSACMVKGLHRLEVKEFLVKAAKSEMQHVQEFSNLIISLGGVPVPEHDHFLNGETNPKPILEYASHLESLVLTQYAARMKEADELGGEDGLMIRVFLEEKFLHSREDRDEINQLLG